VGHTNLNQAAELTQMVVIPLRLDDWGTALDAALAVKKQALAFGFQQAEMDRVLNATRTRLQTSAMTASVRPSHQIANQLVDPSARLRVYTSPATDLALFEELTRGLAVADLNSALPKAFAGQGVLAQFVTPTPLPGGQAAFSARYAAADSTPAQR
jgi:zinc protease